MTAIAEILKTLGASRDGVVSSAEVFPLIDLDQVARELRLVEHGEEEVGRTCPHRTCIRRWCRRFLGTPKSA